MMVHAKNYETASTLNC